jgi:hypothetical protein
LFKFTKFEQIWTIWFIVLDLAPIFAQPHPICANFRKFDEINLPPTGIIPNGLLSKGGIANCRNPQIDSNLLLSPLRKNSGFP